MKSLILRFATYVNGIFSHEVSLSLCSDAIYCLFILATNINFKQQRLVHVVELSTGSYGREVFVLGICEKYP